MKTKWNPLTTIEEIKKLEKIKDLKKEKTNLDLIKDNLKLLKKRTLPKEEKPCITTKLVIPYGNPKNYTEEEYKSSFYREFKNSTFKKTEVDDLYKFVLNKLNPVFKPVTKKDEISLEHPRSESYESESSESELKVTRKNEIFFEHSDSESSELESD